MNTKTVLITEELRKIINNFVKLELVPACAVGNELYYVNGSLVIKTFNSNGLIGTRIVDPLGQVINVIAEKIIKN